MPQPDKGTGNSGKTSSSGGRIGADTHRPFAAPKAEEVSPAEEETDDDSSGSNENPSTGRAGGSVACMVLAIVLLLTGIVIYPRKTKASGQNS